MDFASKLKALRKQFGLSQEVLASRIGVSRQAVTKWETDGGLPDIENLMAIAALFSISLDELLSEERLKAATAGYAYESVTEYDISRPMHYDIHTPGALEVSLAAVEGEKLMVRLASNALASLERDYKVKLDEHRSGLDVEVLRVGTLGEAEGKEALRVFITLPRTMLMDVELFALADRLVLSDLDCPIEVDGKLSAVSLEAVTGKVALGSGSDMVITADGLPADLEVSQVNATSRLCIPAGLEYFAKARGRTNRIIVSRDGKPMEAPSDPDAPRRVEVNGLHCELAIEEQSE